MAKAKAHRTPRPVGKRTSEPLMAIQAMPTRERLAQAQGAFQIGGDRRTKVFRMLDTPLESLYNSEKLTGIQYDALRSLHLHWYVGLMSGSAKSVDLNRISSPDWARMSIGERELMHRQCFDVGWSCLDVSQKVVVNVVALEESGLQVAGFKLGYASPYRGRIAALELLQSGGDALAKAWRA